MSNGLKRELLIHGGEYFRLEEAADILNIRKKTLSNWIYARRIGYCRIGRGLRIPKSELVRITSEGFVPALESTTA